MIQKFQCHIYKYLPYNYPEVPVSYSQIPALLNTGSSTAMYMIIRLTRELKFTLLFTVRNLNQFHALCGIVKLHSNNISSHVFSSCPEIRTKLVYVCSALNPHSWLISMSSFPFWFENRNKF
jgi:hypothetical protein